MIAAIRLGMRFALRGLELASERKGLHLQI